MDITEELEKIDNNPNAGDNIIEKALIEQNELLKKIHLLKVISAATKVEDLITTDLFKKEKIKSIQFILASSGDYNYKIDFDLLNENNDIVASHYTQYNKLAKNLNEIFTIIGEFDTKLINEQHFSDDQQPITELNLGVREKIIDLFLCNELKKVYDYHRMKSELFTNNEVNSKKMKM